MKKLLIATGIAALALASVAGAQGYTFSSNLTVGSTGADVVALQTMLISAGYSIPAVQAGTPKGYFGSQTKSAVQKYQAAKSVPATGFVGPLTRAALNGGSATVSTTVCPVGFTCTPTGTTPAPVTPVANPTMITTPGVGGTLAVTLQGTPSGASLDKGEAEDVARYKLQAASSDMQITSIAVDFDTRLWLMAGSVTIKDDNGTVIASKTGLTANDFTELTVGSSYRLYVPVSGYIIPKTGIRYLTVNVGMLPVSDRSAATVTITQVQVRSVDGTGVTDTQTEGTDRTFSYTGSNTGQVVATVNAQSPLKRLVQISNSAETKDVVLAKVDLKSQNRDATLRTLKIYVNTDGTSVNTLFSRIKITAGSQSYTANTVSVTGNDTTASSTVTFTDLTIPLPKDQYVTVTVTADVAQPASIGALDGKSASTSLKANATNVSVEDSTYNTVTVNATTLIGSDVTVSASGAILSSMSATLGSPVLSNNVTVAQPVSFTYTLTAGDNSLFVSANPVTALSTTSTGYGTAANASSTLTTVTATPSEMPGDSSGTYFVVPAGGSRQFKWSGSVSNDPPRGVVQRTFSITAVKYDTDTTNLNDNNINYNLGALKVEPVI